MITVDNDISIAIIRLEAWGNWLRAVKQPTLYYKSASNFCQKPQSDTEYDDEEAEEIEQIMLKMQQTRLLQYRVLLQEYYHQATIRTGCQSVKGADNRTIDRNQYSKARDAAINYIAGILAERRSNN